MFGKASLLLVFLFSTIFLLYTSNMVATATQTVDIYSEYYSLAVAENIALAGVNLGCNALFTSPTWTTGYSSLSFQGGRINVAVNVIPGDVTGDTIQMVSTGGYGYFQQQMEIKIHASNFAKFGNFYSSFNSGSGAVYAATGDTMDGPFHVNGTINVSGTPVFMGKVTAKNGINKLTSSSKPKFLGDVQTGVDLVFNPDISRMETYASDAGYLFEGTTSKPFIDVDMTFNNNGTVTYKTRTKSTSSGTWSSYSSTTTIAITTLAPNGCITIKQGNVTVRGVLDGKVTVTALANGTGTAIGASFGNVFIDNSITYLDDPRTVPNSNDMLGLVAENRVEVTYNNSRGNINIMGSLMSKNDGLTINNYSSYSSIYNMNIYGGVIGKYVKATADYNSAGNPVRGYRFVQKYDPRLLQTIPPYYPATGNYEILSWLEKDANKLTTPVQ